MKWIGTQVIYNDIRLNKSIYAGAQGLGDINIYARNVNILNDEVDSGSDTTSGDPKFRVGSSTTECFQLTANYATNTKNMQIAVFKTLTDSATADDGRFRFMPDNVNVLEIDDGGINLSTNMGISINGTDILTDSGGDATLSNINALDSTTEGTIESAIDTLNNLTCTGNLTFDSVALSAIQTSAESFANNDTSLMTSAAIEDKILSYGYSTGDITGVRLTADDTNIATVTSGSADFTIAGGTGIDTTVSGTTVTITPNVASTSSRGVVELATTAEVTTGTDANRVVTPDTLKDGYQGSAEITTLGTIGTGTWQGTAIASAYLDADTAHKSTQIQATYSSFTADDIDTKHYIAFNDGDSENTNTSNVDLPIIAPVDGKLLRVSLRASRNITSHNMTFRLETQAGVNFSTGPSIVGTQSGAGCNTTTMTTYDFTSSLDSGDNLIDAGDAVYLSIESDTSIASTKYYITCIWEWDYSSL
tara:strand:- start:883 stop:2313 length:1431 start_codon:yes stop_codon:yes gene_type:complete